MRFSLDSPHLRDYVHPMYVRSTVQVQVVDPVTGRESIIFSCFNQDQELDRVDFPNLAARLRQNTVQEKLGNQWLDQLLQQRELPHV